MAFLKKKKKDAVSAADSHAFPIWGALTAAKARADMTGSEAIYAAVSRLTNTIASMPLHLYHKHDIAYDDSRERAVGYAPNRNMTAFGWKLALECSRCVQGVAYILIVPNDDWTAVERLDPIAPEKVNILKSPETGDIWYRITMDDGQALIVHNSQMIAIFHQTTDGVTPISPIEVLGGTLKYDKTVQEISIDQLSKVTDSVVLTFPTSLSDERKKAYMTNFKDAYTSSHGHLIILDGGVTAEMLKGSVVDPKVLDVDNITKRKVAAVFNMPPKMLGDTSAAGYQTSEQDIMEYLKLTIMPIVRQWEEALNRKLLSYDEIREGYAFRFDTDALLRGDTQAMADKYQKGIRGGWLTPNEARAEYGMAPVEHGDEPMVSRDVMPLRIIVEHPEMLLGGSSVKGGE